MDILCVYIVFVYTLCYIINKSVCEGAPYIVKHLKDEMLFVPALNVETELKS